MRARTSGACTGYKDGGAGSLWNDGGAGSLWNDGAAKHGKCPVWASVGCGHVEVVLEWPYVLENERQRPHDRNLFQYTPGRMRPTNAENENLFR
ncbi:hypothetical protein L3X38_035050 [Prunus dulcis]|uniref:Uncharacterized protein n=1 Tax=Prunus dulcis TaxID=3755 RepID=A0AAD4VJZ9_PRUDU|nr:hypothetical protein L3X38_035050 [Prunus dulcis]